MIVDLSNAGSLSCLAMSNCCGKCDGLVGASTWCKAFGNFLHGYVDNVPNLHWNGDRKQVRGWPTSCDVAGQVSLGPNADLLC